MTLPADGRLSCEQWKSDQAEKIETIAHAGTTEAVSNDGRPVVLLTVRGRRSGVPRTVPLMRVEHQGRYAVVASQAGAPRHPVWYLNATANPDVELQDGSATRRFTAREVSGEERQVWWDRAVAAYRDYSDYQERTERPIPVLVLEPHS